MKTSEAKGLGVLVGYRKKRSEPAKCEFCFMESKDCVKVHFADNSCICLEKADYSS